MNGGSSASYLACTPSVPLLALRLKRPGNRRLSRLPVWDHVHCTVEPSPGHSWCREIIASDVFNDMCSQREGCETARCLCPCPRKGSTYMQLFHGQCVALASASLSVSLNVFVFSLSLSLSLYLSLSLSLSLPLSPSLSLSFFFLYLSLSIFLHAIDHIA